MLVVLLVVLLAVLFAGRAGAILSWPPAERRLALHVVTHTRSSWEGGANEENHGLR